MIERQLKEKISPYELFGVVFLVPFGSALLFYLTPEAKQYGWIVILIYILPALMLQHLYLTLYKHYPEDSIVTYLPKIFGKVIGTILSIIYVLYFLYIAARVLRDFSSLINISTMTQTPILLITIFLTITVTYGVSRGFENICRVISTFFPGMMIFLAVVMLLFYRTPNVVHYQNIFPILGEDIFKSVLRGWRLITFPYGETIVFSMIYSNINESRKIRKSIFAAVIAEGIILALITILYIVGLGINFSQRDIFPLLNTLRMIRISGFLDRLDVLIIIVLVIGGFTKISFFMYAAIAGTAELLNIKSKNSLAWPFGIVTMVASMLIAKNFMQHLKIGFEFTPKYIHLPLQIGVPILALIVHYMRNGFNKKKTD